VSSCLVVFSSLNQVALLKRHLYGEGVYLEMLRAPQCLSATGCSFALRCRLDDLPRLRQACTHWKIAPGGYFEEDSSLEETTYRILKGTESST
jgi:hypothetical protein